MGSIDPAAQQYHFVLVHGAGHGAWCWYKLRTLLEASGHNVTCIDLKSCGTDPTDFGAVHTFQQYNEPLTTFISSLPADEKVVLVGHSVGGLNITDVLYKFPQKVHVAVYLAANMMKNGYGITSSTAENFKSVDIMEFLQSLLGTMTSANKWKIVFASNSLPGIMVKPEYQRMTYYHMSPVEDSTLGEILIRPTAVMPLLKVEFEGEVEAVEKVPRVYIRTLKDQLMSQKSQDQMIKQWPPSKVFATGSDHSAFFSTPDTLYHYLLQAANSF